MPPIVAVNTSLGGMKGSTYNSFHKGKILLMKNVCLLFDYLNRKPMKFHHGNNRAKHITKFTTILIAIHFIKSFM